MYAKESTKTIIIQIQIIVLNEIAVCVPVEVVINDKLAIVKPLYAMIKINAIKKLIPPLTKPIFLSVIANNK